jgi:hypothetical protein
MRVPSLLRPVLAPAPAPVLPVLALRGGGGGVLGGLLDDAREAALGERRVEARVLGAEPGDLRPQLRALDPERVDDGAALLPAPVRLVRRGERGVEQRGARLELLDVSARWWVWG